MLAAMQSTPPSMIGSRRFLRARVALIIMAGAAIGLSGCGESGSGDESSKVNGSVHVPAGKPAASATSVNGSIHIDENAAVTNATTVNGNVHMGPHSTAASLNTVNGSVTLDSGAHDSGSAASVNGDLTMQDGSEVGGSLANVNGKITLIGAHVTGGIKTVNGDISITGASRVEGGILVEKPTGSIFNLDSTAPRIVIGPGVTVQGDLRFERKVQLYVSDRATIGPVTGATAVAFTGDAPPN
jgi:DUF4097 and DUF4098 domain-containing protein YvlB